MSFDYSPPRWWVPALIGVALAVLALLTAAMTVVCYGLWQLLQVLPAGLGDLLTARIADGLGPLRVT